MSSESRMLDHEGERMGDDKAQVISMEIGIWTRVEEIIEDEGFKKF